jgi:hypothetical protein
MSGAVLLGLRSKVRDEDVHEQRCAVHATHVCHYGYVAPAHTVLAVRVTSGGSMGARPVV